MIESNHITATSPEGGLVRHWTKGVRFQDKAMQQVMNVADLNFTGVVAVMPDVHWGMGATIGSVIPTFNAVIPAAVGVDIGCGMMALKTNLHSRDLPDSCAKLRSDIESVVPVGFEQHSAATVASELVSVPDFVVDRITSGKHVRSKDHPLVKAGKQMGTLGGGNHFIELCLDEEAFVWIMLHSGSRGIGNLIGRVYIDLAKEDMRTHQVNLPDEDLAYLSEGTQYFLEYIRAVGWAQQYALDNRKHMMHSVLKVVRENFPGRQVVAWRNDVAINCHHNYVEWQEGPQCWLTRKGAVDASKGKLGIIPGSMGARSFIVKGKGNPMSHNSCAHGAGRMMSRGEAKRTFTISEHEDATFGVECRKDKGVLDETPGAYKDINAVMAAQADLVEVVHTLKQFVCVKG